MEALELRVRSSANLPLDTRHHLRDEHQIDDQRGSEQGVLAHIEDADGLMPAHEDLAVVLVEGALVVADGRHVLDDDAVVRVFAGVLVVQHRVGRDHVVHDV